jgi:hypothetical protein
MPWRLELAHWSTAVVLGAGTALSLTAALRRRGTRGLWLAASIITGLGGLVAAVRPHPSWDPWYGWRLLTWRYAEWSVSSQLGPVVVGVLIGACAIHVVERRGWPSRLGLAAASIACMSGLAWAVITLA